MQNILSALIACGLVGGAIGYCEIQGWGRWQRYATFAGCGMMASMFAASPLMWWCCGLYSGTIEQLAMTITLAAGLWQTVEIVYRWLPEEMYAVEEIGEEDEQLSFE